MTKENGDKLVEKLKREYDDLLKDRTHGLLGGAFCLCISCIFQGYKARHKKSRITKDHFFLGRLLYTIAARKEGYFDFKRNWKIVEDLFNEVTGVKFKHVSYPNKDPKYVLGARCYKIYGNALIEHQNRARELCQTIRDKYDKYGGPLGAMFQFQSLVYKNYYERACDITLKRLAKVYKLVKAKKELSVRDISREDSRFKLFARGEEVSLWQEKKKISLFPYLYELERLGVISFEVEKNSIRFLKNDNFLDFFSSSAVNWRKVQ